VNDAHPGKTLRWFVSDEARVGQQGTLTRVWARTGTRPAVVKQCEYEWVYLWAAADPFSGDAIAMITPTVNAELMQTFVDGLSGHIKPDEHAILVLDNAGWHRAKELRWPANVTPLFLPPYSPELNAQRRREPVAVAAEPVAVEPGVRGRRRPAAQDPRGLAGAHARTDPDAVPLPVDRARGSSLRRIRPDRLGPVVRRRRARARQPRRGRG
jgi:hypothetical protein